MSQGKSSINSLPLLLTAAIALSLGVLIYITARTPGSAWFLPYAWSATLPWPPSALYVTGSLPTFFHTFGFSLIFSLLLGGGRRSAVWASATWFAVEAAFETGQYPGVSDWLVTHLPQWFHHVWLLKHTGAYFSTGVFDPFDILAAAAGALLACLLVAANELERSQHDEQIT